jgi:hypothetical protein
VQLGCFDLWVVVVFVVFHGLLSIVGAVAPIGLDKIVRGFALTALAKTDCRRNLFTDFKKYICCNLAVLCFQKQSAVKKVCGSVGDGLNNFQDVCFVDHLISFGLSA